MRRPPTTSSAFVRWRPQVLQFWDGVNIYDKMLFPTPPLMPITLYPLMVLPTIVGAMCWFAIKVGHDHRVAGRCASGSSSRRDGPLSADVPLPRPAC